MYKEEIDQLSDPDFSAIGKHIKYMQFKKFFSRFMSFITLPLTVPILAITALIVFFEDFSPPVIVQERIGKNGKPFRMYKLRTLKWDSTNEFDINYLQAYIKGEHPKNHNGIHKPLTKEKTLRVGNFLRKTSLDELPQVINILRGEMRWIGPRPNLPMEVEVYQDWHHERLNVFPGITGWAQVNGRSNISFDELVSYDIEYVRNMSLGLDLKILLRTVVVIFLGIGAG